MHVWFLAFFALSNIDLGCFLASFFHYFIIFISILACFRCRCLHCIFFTGFLDYLCRSLLLFSLSVSPTTIFFLLLFLFIVRGVFFPINAVCTQHNERPNRKKETDRIANCAIFTSQGLLSVNVFVPFFAFPYDQISLFFVPSLPSLFRCDCLSGIFCIEY